MRWHPQGISPDVAGHGPAGLGAMRQILAGLGRFWFGRVIADDLSTEGFGPLCWVLRNSDAALQCRAG